LDGALGFSNGSTYLAGSDNLLVGEIVALQSWDEVADVVLDMQNILTWDDYQCLETVTKDSDQTNQVFLLRVPIEGRGNCSSNITYVSLIKSPAGE
jgi:hypothetical protein